MAAIAFLKGMLSNPQPVSRGAVIAQTEIALKETEVVEEGIKAGVADEATPTDPAKFKLPLEAASKPGTMAAAPVVLPVLDATSKAAEPDKPEVSAAEVFEGARQTTVAAALLRGIASNPEPIFPPKSEITPSRIAPKETETGRLGASDAVAFVSTHQQLGASKSPEESVEKSEPAVSSPLALPPAATASQQAELKQSEASSVEVFEEPLEESAMPALLDASVARPKPPASFRADLVAEEIAPQEQEGKRPEPDVAAAREEPLKESVNANIPSAEASAPLAMEVIHSDVAPHESAQSTSIANPPEASAPVVSAPVVSAPVVSAPVASAPVVRPPSAMDEGMKRAAISSAAKIEPKDAPPPAFLTEARLSKLTSKPAAPFIREPAGAAQKDESISALLISLAALAASNPETLPDPAHRLEEEIPTHGTERIWLGLAAILKHCPKEILAGELPRMGADLGIELSFAQIEPQIASGAVEISSLRFIAALPPEYMQYFVVREDVKVPIPMEEILRNLPESERARFAFPAKSPAFAGVEQIGAEAAQPKSELPNIHSIAPAAQARATHASVEALSEAAALTPHSIPEIPKPPTVDFRETAQPEHTPPEPEAPATAVADPVPPPSPEHSWTLFDAAAETSGAETSSAVGEAQEPGPAAEPGEAQEPGETAEAREQGEQEEAAVRLSKEKSEELSFEPPPEPEPVQPPLPLNIPTFRVFAPPPLQVSASIVSGPATSVPLAWAGHASTQPPRSDEPREEENVAVHTPTPPEDSVPQQEDAANSPAPNAEASEATGSVEQFAEEPGEVQGTLEAPTPNEDAGITLHLHLPVALSRPAPSLSQGGSFPPDATPSGAEALIPPPIATETEGFTPVTEPAALPAENEEAAEVLLAAPETEMPEGVKVDSELSAPPAEYTALIPPPVIRPVAIPPPPIFAFAPAVESQNTTASSEGSPAVESPASAGGETPWSPLAFVSGSENAPATESAAESQTEATAEMNSPAVEAVSAEPAPDAPKPEFASNEPTATEEAPKNLPELGGKSTGEKEPIPAPPRIVFSVPKLPALHLPLGGPQAEAGISAPEPILAPPPLPLVRFNQDALQTLFMTDEFLDLPAVCRHVSALPGIQACVVSRRGEKAHAGELPSGFEFSELLAFAPGVTQVAGRLPIGALQHFTLYAETHSVSFFEAHEAYLCVVHRARSFIPGVREKLVTVADELSKS